MVCMMQNAIELAAKTCQCLPWFMMQNLTLQSAVCDPIGLNCFDNLTVNYLDSNVNNECPQVFVRVCLRPGLILNQHKVGRLRSIF